MAAFVRRLQTDVEKHGVGRLLGSAAGLLAVTFTHGEANDPRRRLDDRKARSQRSPAGWRAWLPRRRPRMTAHRGLCVFGWEGRPEHGALAEVASGVGFGRERLARSLRRDGATHFSFSRSARSGGNRSSSSPEPLPVLRHGFLGRAGVLGKGLSHRCLTPNSALVTLRDGGGDDLFTAREACRRRADAGLS